jgi:hypothetical protein
MFKNCSSSLDTVSSGRKFCHQNYKREETWISTVATRKRIPYELKFSNYLKNTQNKRLAVCVCVCWTIAANTALNCLYATLDGRNQKSTPPLDFFTVYKTRNGKKRHLSQKLFKHFLAGCVIISRREKWMKWFVIWRNFQFFQREIF